MSNRVAHLFRRVKQLESAIERKPYRVVPAVQDTAAMMTTAIRQIDGQRERNTVKEIASYWGRGARCNYVTRTALAERTGQRDALVSDASGSCNRGVRTRDRCSGGGGRAGRVIASKMAAACGSALSQLAAKPYVREKRKRAPRSVRTPACSLSTFFLLPRVA